MKTRHHNDGLRKVCACPRRKWAKCEHPWHGNLKWAGVAYRFSLDRYVGKRVEAKGDAKLAFEQAKADIRAGVGRLFPTVAIAGPVTSTLTLEDLVNTYERAYVTTERPASLKRRRTQADAICRRVITLPTGAPRAIGAWAVADISTEAIKQFQELRRPAGVFAMNRDVGVLRAIFNWGISEGIIDRTPFKRVGMNTIKRAPEPRRDRRLNAGELEGLLAACPAQKTPKTPPHRIRALIEAAIETGCRSGELTTLQWAQVRLEGARPAITLTAAKTKTKTLREVPISARLKAILEMRRHDPAGKPHPASAYVFGDETGGYVSSFKRAWATVRLKAHGFTPEYVKVSGPNGKPKSTAALAEASRVALDSIDLHFHDLRREAGSRWLDASVPLHTISKWLGHTNISQTSTYLAVTDTGSHEAMARFDAALGRSQPIATADGTITRIELSEGTMGDSAPRFDAGKLH